MVVFHPPALVMRCSPKTTSNIWYWYAKIVDVGVDVIYVVVVDVVVVDVIYVDVADVVVAVVIIIVWIVVNVHIVVYVASAVVDVVDIKILNNRIPLAIVVHRHVLLLVIIDGSVIICLGGEVPHSVTKQQNLK